MPHPQLLYIESGALTHVLKLIQQIPTKPLLQRQPHFLPSWLFKVALPKSVVAKADALSLCYIDLEPSVQIPRHDIA